MGIYFGNQCQKWVARLMKDHKPLLYRFFKTEIDAGRCRDLYIRLNLPNDHYKLNFEWADADIQEWKIKLNM